jgi:outer membrane protein assembly factor BamB
MGNEGMKPHHNRILGVLIAWIVTAIFSEAQDWPQWRGPNRDGVWKETNVLQTFPTNGLKVRWRAPVGYGFSSPVVADGRVYVTDSQLARPKLRERVLCFDETTGKSLWTYSYEVAFPEWAFSPGQEQGPNATPVVNQGKVYAPGPLSHDLFCLDAVKGALLWHKDLMKDYRIEETASLAASPLVDGDRLILVTCGKPDAGVVALDKNSGKELWRSLSELTAHSSPVIVSAGGVRQLIVWTLQSVAGLDPATGKPYWRERFPGDSSSVVATPVLSGNRLLIGGLMLKLDSDKPNAVVVWPEKTSRRVLSSTSTPLILHDYVFSATSSGELVCLEAATGRQVWATDKATDPKYKASTSIHLTVNGDSVLLFNDRGELIRARLSGDGYHEMSRVSLIEPTYGFGGRKMAWAAPAYAKGHVIARNDREVIRASLLQQSDPP